MASRSAWAAGVVGALWAGGFGYAAGRPARPGPDPAAALAALAGNPTDALAGTLRGLLLQELPTPLFQDASHWGRQRDVARGLRRFSRGRADDADDPRELKNDGLWWRVTVTAPNAADSLVLDLRDVRQMEPGRMTFTAFVSFDTDAEYERQRWNAGRRLYSGGVRARARVKLTLDCEAVTRLESGKLLPEAVFRLRVLRSDFRYDNLVFEHVLGVGGEAARLLGEAAHASVNQWRPSLERRLTEKVNAAIVKAGDTKEVRLGLSRLWDKK
jgi:hypothetical protein